jgi:large conductance mechanosensitive channel
MKVPFSDLVKEFKSFAFRGNMIDLAVAVVIGAAFGEVIKAMVDFVLMPLIGYIPLAKGGYEAWRIGDLRVGLFLGAIVKFVLVAAGVFVVVVKLLGVLMRAAAPPPAGPVAKQCPFCISDIPIKATKCKFCASAV